MIPQNTLSEETRLAAIRKWPIFFIFQAARASWIRTINVVHRHRARLNSRVGLEFRRATCGLQHLQGAFHVWR